MLPSTLCWLASSRTGAASGHQPQLLPGWSARCWPRPEQAPSCGRTHPLSPYLQRLAHRSAVGGRQLAVGGSAAWLRGGGLTRRARWKPLDGLTRAPGLLLTPVPGAQPRGGEVTRRTSQAVEPRAQPWLGYELARRVGRKCAATGTTCPPLAGGQPPWPARSCL